MITQQELNLAYSQWQNAKEEYETKKNIFMSVFKHELLNKIIDGVKLDRYKLAQANPPPTKEEKDFHDKILNETRWMVYLYVKKIFADKIVENTPNSKYYSQLSKLFRGDAVKIYENKEGIWINWNPLLDCIEQTKNNYVTLESEYHETHRLFSLNISQTVSQHTTSISDVNNILANQENKINQVEADVVEIKENYLTPDNFREKMPISKEKFMAVIKVMKKRREQIIAETKKREYEATIYGKISTFYGNHAWKMWGGVIMLIALTIIDAKWIKRFWGHKLANKFWKWFYGPLDKEDWGWPEK